MKLVDDVEEQITLEELIDESKPPVPPECTHLHYLLFTPFRYSPRHDSRFARARSTDRAFYAAEAVSTARLVACSIAREPVCVDIRVIVFIRRRAAAVGSILRRRRPVELARRLVTSVVCACVVLRRTKGRQVLPTFHHPASPRRRGPYRLLVTPAFGVLQGQEHRDRSEIGAAGPVGRRSPRDDWPRRTSLLRAS